MKKPNLIVHYSIVAVAMFSLAACGHDRDRVARNDTNGTRTGDTTNNSADRATGGDLSSGERSFITKAAQDSMAEVEMARLAEQKATSPRVKALARDLVADHTKAIDELKSVAANANVTLPNELDSSHRSDVNKLRDLSGAKFDREFVKHAVDDHKDDVKEFEKEADNGTYAPLKHFASNMLPSLRNHQEMAQSIDNNLKDRNAHNSNADRSTSDADRSSK